LCVLAPVSSAAGDDRIQFLADRLAYPPISAKDDFRVRTNAALALGATDDDAAVQPLCAGLGDPNEVVRQAAAVALRKLARPSSVACLNDRASREPSARVKAEIARTLESLGKNSGSRSVAAPGAKYYVAVSRVTNRTSRPSAEIDRIVRDAIVARLEEGGQNAIAPPDETLDAAKAAIAHQRLKGYFLSVSVEKFDYSDEGLRVRVKIAVFSYPGKDLRGEVPASGTLPGARTGDKAAEDQLVSAIAGRAAELFSENFK
jgi:hypothetical protein